MQIISVAELDLMSQLMPPKVTPFTVELVLNPEPEMVTVLPPCNDPVAGLTPVTSKV